MKTNDDIQGNDGVLRKLKLLTHTPPFRAGKTTFRVLHYFLHHICLIFKYRYCFVSRDIKAYF